MLAVEPSVALGCELRLHSMWYGALAHRPIKSLSNIRLSAYHRPILTFLHHAPQADLMKSASELMMMAVVTHNNLIQKARWSNFGSVIEQEGDSYTIIFEEAGDAVKFCLQVSVKFCL